MSSADLESLRAMLSDRRTHLVIGKITKVEVLTDNSAVRVQLISFPEELEMVAVCGWAATGPSAGIFGGLPVVGDLVLLAVPDNDMPYIIARLTSTEDTIPWQVALGHMVLKALSGKKAYLVSDEKILIGAGEMTEASEPLVLGAVMKSYMGDLYTRVGVLADKLNALCAAIATGPVAVDSLGGSAVCHPTLLGTIGATAVLGIRAEIADLKLQLAGDQSKYVTTAATNVVSQLAFTER
jgi:hypothetical protein